MKKALLITWLAFPTWPLAAEERPADVQVSMTKDTDSNDVLQGRFRVASSTGVAWKVLTDYDNMASFVSSVKSSRVVKMENGKDVVEQIMTGKAGIFRKRVHLLLEIDTSTPNTIAFQDTLKKSFHHYKGAWTMVPADGELEIRYDLEANPAFFSPDFLALNAFKNSVKSLLTEVREQITLKNGEGL